MPILDGIFFSLKEVDEDEEEVSSASMRLPEEYRIYQHLDELSVHPVDVANFLKDSRVHMDTAPSVQAMTPIMCNPWGFRGVLALNSKMGKDVTVGSDGEIKSEASIGSA